MELMMLAVLMTVAGTGLLYATWTGRMWNGVPAVLCGWLILLLAFVPWMRSLGTEFGTVLGLLMPSVAALVWVAWSGRRRSGGNVRPDERPWQAGRLPRVSTARQQFLRLLLVVPVAGVMATWITIMAGNLLPWSEMSRLATIVIAMPVVWGMLSAWLISAARWRRPVVLTAAAGIASALLLYSGVV